MNGWLVGHPSGQIIVAIMAAIISTYLIDRLKPGPAWTRVVAGVAGVGLVLLIPVSWFSWLFGQLACSFQLKGWALLLSGLALVGVGRLSMILHRKSTAVAETQPFEPQVAPTASAGPALVGVADFENLRGFSSRFHGRLVYTFFQDIAEFHSVDLDLVAKFDANIDRYLAPDKTFLLERLESAKRGFLVTLEELLEFTGTNFAPAGGGARPVFYGDQKAQMHRSPRLRQKYMADEVRLNALVSAAREAWGELVKVACELAPTFAWPE